MVNWLNQWAFLLTRLSRGVTSLVQSLQTGKNISTHTPLARRDGLIMYTKELTEISTHTPLARRDISPQAVQAAVNISTHTPLARRDCQAAKRA